MRVFVAGASGAIGQPLNAVLVRQGHMVTGMTRSASGAQKLYACKLIMRHEAVAG